MDSLRKFIISIVALVIGMGTTITVCIYGWGLEPQSWFWIIGVYLFGHIVSFAFLEIARD